MYRRGLCAVLIFAAVASCLGFGAGSKAFKSGEDAQKAGDLEEAYRQYKAALEGEPKNTRYRQAVEDTGKELARAHRAEARAKEKSQDWAGASEAWARAAEYAPNDAELQVRRDLSALKAKNLGPDEWYDGVKVVFDKYPQQKVVGRTLEGARAAAYQYNVNLGQQFLGSGEGARAHTYFERARTIDPTTPGLSPELLTKAEALAMAEDAGARLEAGDAVTAYDLYGKAYEKMPLPEIKRDMAKARAKASAILTKLESARDRVKRKRYVDALRIYGTILDLEGAPPFVEQEAATVRQDLLADMVADANARAEKRQVRQAHQILTNALSYANLGRVERDTYKAAIDHARAGRPKTAMEVLDKVGLEATNPLYGAAHNLALAAARDQLANAERTAKRSAEKALAMLVELQPFEGEIQEIAALQRQLRAGSFQELLDEALVQAKKGDATEASTLLLAALNASNAPANMREPAAEGCDHLKEAHFAAAQQSFEKALVTAPRSKLAERAIEISQLMRKSGEQAAVEVIQSGKGDQERAVATLEDALAVEPNHRGAREAQKALLSRAKGKGTDAEVASLLQLAARLSPGGVKKAIDDGVAKLAAADHAGAESAFGEAKGDEVAEVGREIARTRMLAALSSGAKGAAKGDEAAANALAQLLQKDPANRDAQAAVRSLIAQATEHADKKEDTEAARFLRLATIATSPAPGVKNQLDSGNSALAKGDMIAAEKAFADALDIEPENKVASAGYQIAKQARVGMLDSAVAEAKASGNASRAGEALRKTLEIDPTSPEAKKAFGELLAEAKRQGDAGNDAQAAGLLDAANVASKPEAAKKKISEAIGMLAKGDHDGASAAFGAIIRDAESQVATTGKQIADARRRTVLVERAKALENGSDLASGAAAVASLLAIDPADASAKRAIDATLIRAEKASADGDDKLAARELTAAATARSEDASLAIGIGKLEAGRFQEAEEAFTDTESPVAVAGQKIARGRRLGTLRENLTGQGDDAARAIALLLKTDPGNKEARKAFEQLLDEARKAGRNNDDATASDKIKLACIASNPPDDLRSAIEAGVMRLAESKHAEAEKAFLEAVALAKDSKVARVGVEVARTRRTTIEKNARTALGKPGDPRPHARVLQESLLVEPKSRTVRAALYDLVDRARKAAKAGADSETAQVLEAAALLENSGADVQVKLTEASGLYAQGSFEAAETVFGSVDGGGAGSKVADVGKRLARERRISVLEAEWREARHNKDLLREAAIVRQILDADPRHREARAASKRLEKEVGTNRIGAAKTSREMGKLGVAYIYLERALKLNADDDDAKKEMEAVTAKLKERMDLILLVERVSREKAVGPKVCLGFDEVLRDEIMSVSSKRTDLGGFVLSPGWTKAVEEKSDKAPEVSASIAVKVTECETTPEGGKSAFTWELQVPRKGMTAAKGEFAAELESGIIPKDEQDEAGNNAKKALATKATAAFLDSFEGQRDTIDLWMLTLAEYGMRHKDVATVADAYARLSIKKPESIDPARLAKVEKYLTKELR